MRIKGFQEYSDKYKMGEIFLNSFESSVNESGDKKDYKSIQDEEISKLKSGIKGDIGLNFKLVATFGAGFGAIYPIVDKVLNNSNAEIDIRSVVLLTITAISMIVLEEGKWAKSDKDKEELTKETQVILEELKMAGFPNVSTGTSKGSDNSILSKVVNIIKGIKNIFINIKKNILNSKLKGFIRRSGIALVSGFTDMLSYISILIPISNGIGALVGMYNVNPSSFLSNITSLAVGIGIIISKHGISYLMNKLKNFLKLSGREKTQIEHDIEEIDSSIIKRIGSEMPTSHEGELIKEQ